MKRLIVLFTCVLAILLMPVVAIGAVDCFDCPRQSVCILQMPVNVDVSDVPIEVVEIVDGVVTEHAGHAVLSRRLGGVVVKVLTAPARIAVKVVKAQPLRKIIKARPLRRIAKIRPLKRIVVRVRH